MAMSNMAEEDGPFPGFPAKPSELRQIPDNDLAVLYRKLVYSGRHTYDSVIERELSIRLMAALVGLRRASNRASLVLISLTVALVALTGVLVWLTTRL
jgi:hypothetical protein